MQRKRLLALGLVVSLACALTLVACNSNSTSSTQPSGGKATSAETTSATSSRPQGLVGAATAHTK